MIIGNLTRDPELKALPSGTKVANVSLATNRVFKDKDGKKQESVEYHNVVVFGRTAELVAQYLKKGNQAYFEGRLQTRNWEQDGQKKYRTEIIAETVQFGSKGSGSSSQTSSKPEKEDDSKGASGDSIQYPEETISPDDIPF
jgi:single-strand DNA-binding protein